MTYKLTSLGQCSPPIHLRRPHDITYHVLLLLSNISTHPLSYIPHVTKHSHVNNWCRSTHVGTNSVKASSGKSFIKWRPITHIIDCDASPVSPAPTPPDQIPSILLWYKLITLWLLFFKANTYSVECRRFIDLFCNSSIRSIFKVMPSRNLITP